jgi:beta-aspartyl-peptidase (threonine type)
VLRAVEAGWRVLAAGGAALDAAIAAVALLEDDPAFNAGLGSVLTEDGEVELDASVMSGETLAAGAVGAVRGVRNPVHSHAPSSTRDAS